MSNTHEAGPSVVGPLLSLGEAASLLRMSNAALCKIIGGRLDGDDGELGVKLRACVVRLSPRRRYIAARPFLSWIEARIRASCGAAGEGEEGGEPTK